MIYTSILGYTEFFFYLVLLCDNFLLHRVSRSFARSYTEFFFPPCYFVIIFCYTELHGVLHGVTQSFFPPCYFVLLFCYTELHRVLHGVTQSFFPSCYFMIIFCYTDHRRVLLFPLCYSVSTLWYSVKLFFIAHSLSESFFSSVLLCEYSVVLCETFFYYT